MTFLPVESTTMMVSLTEKSLSGSFVRLLLETAKEHLLPRFYQKCLDEAGLERYLVSLPTEEHVPVASFLEIAGFMGNVYKLTQDGVYPLFCQNLGTTMAKNMIKQPHWLKIKARADKTLHDPLLSRDERLFKLADLKNSIPRNGVKWVYDGANLIASTNRCIYCYQIHTERPICHARKIYLGSALTWLSGWSFFGEQYQAISCGDSVCAYRFRPLF
jgi:predicted hydrocarbon binding protein